MRDALVTSLLTLDYEKDEYRTPRIAGAVLLNGDIAWLGIVRHDALVVKAISLEVGQARWIATYEANDVRDEQWSDFDATNATEAAIFVVSGGDFMKLTHPITSAAALAVGSRFELACHSI